MDMITVKNKLLNRNFILLVIVIMLIVIAGILFFVLRTKNETPETLLSFESSDSSFSISVPSFFNFSKIEDEDYTLVLKSDLTGSTIYFSQTSANNIRDFNKFIEADKNNFISKFSNISQVSDITESTLQNLPTYNYHFNFNENRYVEVYWILKDSTFYIIDFYINTEKENLSSYIDEIINSLKFN